MRKYFSLTKTLLKSGYQVTDAKSKKWFKVFLYLLLAVCFLPLLGVIYFAVEAALPAYAQIDQSATVLGSLLFLSCIIIFIFSLFLIPSIFYFSSDLDTLLALPLKSNQIIGAKFTVCVLYEYLFSASILIPAYLAYWNYGDMPVMFLPFGIITILLLPIFPLVLSTLFTIVLMRFVPFFQNRDRFNLVTSILLVALGLGFSIFMNSQGTQDESAMLKALFAGGNSLLDVFIKFFPIIPYFAKAIVEGSVPDLFLAIGITIIALAVLMSAGKLLYFKGAIGSGESSASHKELSERKLSKASRKGNKIWTYLKKDFKVIWRTPAYLTNCLLMVVLFPVMVLAMPLLSQGEGMEAFDLGILIQTIERSDEFLAYVIFFSLALGFLFGTFNQIAATAISREGAQYSVMKYLPMSYRDQIHAKLLLGVLVGLIADIAMALSAMLFLPFSWYYYLIFCGCSAITTLLGNSYSIMLDLAKPKLVWEQEAAAVKQNLGSFIAVMIGMALCIVLIVVCFFIPQAWLMISAFGALAAMCLLALLFYFLAGKYAERAMRKL